jgi:hypothetical protein
MKISMLIVLAAALASAQGKSTQDQSAQNTPPRAAKPPDASAPGLPAGATQVEPYLYRYTDDKGKTWMYRRTPFGFSKWEDKPGAEQPVVQNSIAPKVFDLGDSFRFEQRTPFGVSKWTRKKTDLTDDEKAWVAASQAQEKTPAPEKSPAPASQPSAEKK